MSQADTHLPYFFAARIFAHPLPSAPPRSSCGLKPTSCASQESSPLFLLLPPLASIHSELSPIAPFAPAPFFDARLPKLFASVGLSSVLLPNRVTTRLLKLLALISLPLIAPYHAQREAAEAHCSGLPLSVPPLDLPFLEPISQQKIRISFDRGRDFCDLPTALGCHPFGSASFTVPSPSGLVKEYPVRHQAIDNLAGRSRSRTAANIILYGFAMHGEFSHK